MLKVRGAENIIACEARAKISRPRPLLVKPRPFAQGHGHCHTDSVQPGASRRKNDSKSTLRYHDDVCLASSLQLLADQSNVQDFRRRTGKKLGGLQPPEPPCFLRQWYLCWLNKINTVEVHCCAIKTFS